MLTQNWLGAKLELETNNSSSDIYELLKFLYPPPDFCGCAFGYHFSRWVARDAALAHQRVSGSRSAHHCGPRQLSGRESKDDCRNGGVASGTGNQRSGGVTLPLLAGGSGR